MTKRHHSSKCPHVFGQHRGIRRPRLLASATPYPPSKAVVPMFARPKVLPRVRIVERRPRPSLSRRRSSSRRSAAPLEIPPALGSCGILKSPPPRPSNSGAAALTPATAKLSLFSPAFVASLPSPRRACPGTAATAPRTRPRALVPASTGSPGAGTRPAPARRESRVRATGVRVPAGDRVPRAVAVRAATCCSTLCSAAVVAIDLAA